MMSNVQVAIDRELTTTLIQAAMKASPASQGSPDSRAQNEEEQKIIDQITDWLEYHDETGQRISIIGAPYTLRSAWRNYRVMERASILMSVAW